MKKAVGGLILLIICSSILAAGLFYVYRVDLVQIVVSRDMAQKAPDNYSKDKIYSEFSKCLLQVERGNLDKQIYLQKLFEISHRLEKVQYLTEEDIDKLIIELRRMRSNWTLVK